MDRKILLSAVVLVYLAFQGCSVAQDLEDGMESSQDWLSPWEGHVPISDEETDQGMAGMIQWLRQPVPKYPWYASNDSYFYRQPVPDSAYSTFTEYYVTHGTPEFEWTPSVVYFGSGVGLPYSQYISTMPSETSTLWIQGETDWTQYLTCPVGTMLHLIAYTPVEGPAGIYETIQTETTSLTYRVLQLDAGYSILNFDAVQIGRHMLYFVMDNQPSNVIIVDVFPQFAQDQPNLMPPE